MCRDGSYENLRYDLFGNRRTIEINKHSIHKIGSIEKAFKRALRFSKLLISWNCLNVKRFLMLLFIVISRFPFTRKLNNEFCIGFVAIARGTTSFILQQRMSQKYVIWYYLIVFLLKTV